MKRICIVVLRHGDREYLARRYKGKCNIPSIGFMEFYLEEDSEDLKSLVDYAAENEIPYGIPTHTISFSDEDRATLPYFNVWPEYLKGVGGCMRYGDAFSFTCDSCGAGAVQVGPVYFPARHARRCDFFKVAPALVISSRVKNALEEMGATGYELREVFDYKTRKALSEYFQLVITTCLPASSPERQCRLETCKKCGRNSIKYMGAPGFRLDDFKDQKDFYVTKEYTFSKDMPDTSMPYTIVSRRVLEMLNSFEPCACRPVYFEELYQNER